MEQNQRTTVSHAGPGPGPAIFGRDDELARLTHNFEHAIAGAGRVVTVSGEPGIGKTHLVRAFAHQARSAGARVLFGNCHEEPGSPPYWPWTKVLEAARQEVTDELGVGLAPEETELIATLMPSAANQPDPQSPFAEASRARFRLFQAAVHYLVEFATSAPLVIVLDNLHWADKPSMRLLEFLTQEIGRYPILLVCTYRDIEITRKHPLFETLGELARETQVTRLKLRGVEEAAVGKIVQTTVGEIFPSTLIRAVHQHTEGNPLFVVEVARVLAEELATSRSTKVQIRIPDGVREAIGRRLNRLSPQCNELLSAASVLGRGFALPRLQALSNVGHDDLLTLLEEAIAAGIVEPGNRYGEFSFTHAMIQSTLYDELPMSTRIRLHHAAGAILERLQAERPNEALAQIAQHYYVAAQGGDVLPAVRAARRAAEHATSIWAHEEAVRHYEMALDAANMASEDLSHECAHIAIALSIARYHSGASTYLSQQSLELALDYAGRAKDAQLMVDAACWYCLGHAWTTVPAGGHNKVLEHLETALSLIDDADIASQARLLARKAVMLKSSRREAEADAAVYQAIDLARRCGDKAIAADTLTWCISSLRGRPDKVAERIQIGEEALALVQDLDPETTMQVLRYLLLSYQELGDQEQVKSFLAKLRPLAETLLIIDHRYIEAAISAYCALMDGEWSAAQQHIERAAEIGAGSGDLGADGVYGVQMFLLNRELGHLPTFAPVLERFLAEGHRAWAPGLVMLYAELGEANKLRALFDRHGRGFAWVPRDELFLASLAFLAEGVYALKDMGRARELYELLLPYAGQMMVHPTAVCYGPADLYLGMLAGVFDCRDSADKHFEAARSQCKFAASEPWGVHVDLREGEALLNTEPAKARVLLDRCRQRAEHLEMESVVRRLDELRLEAVLPDDLTHREVDVLQLIALGRSNKDISKVLDISLSTVATHVRSILAKTFCANRTEAAAYARQQRLDG